MDAMDPLRQSVKWWQLALLIVVAAITWVGLGSIPGARIVPTATNYSDFLGVFWPTVVATAFGVAIGLWADRFRRQAEEGRRRRQDDSHLAGGAEHALTIIDRNRNLLDQVKKVIDSEGPESLAVVFDTFSWQIVASELPGLNAIKQELGGFFARLLYANALIEAVRSWPIDPSKPQDRVFRLLNEIGGLVDLATPQALELETRLWAVAEHLRNPSSDATLDERDARDLGARAVLRPSI